MTKSSTFRCFGVIFLLITFAPQMFGQVKQAKTQSEIIAEEQLRLEMYNENISPVFCGTAQIPQNSQVEQINLFEWIEGLQQRGTGTWSVTQGYGSGCTNDCIITTPTACSVPGQSVFRVPVVYQMNTTTGCGITMPTTAQLSDQISMMNDYFACQGIPILFYEAQPAVMINTGNCIYDVAQVTELPNVVNIFVFANTGNGTGCNGSAFLPSSASAPTTSIMSYNCYNSFSYTAGSLNCSTPALGLGVVLIHEMGHYLGLHHTHNGYEFSNTLKIPPTPPGTRTECPDGSNGCTTGDFIADTEADPDLSDPCAGTGCDKNPAGCPSPCATPYPTNINTENNVMSYNNSSGCRTTFTPCQKAKMVDALLCVRGLQMCDRDVAAEFSNGAAGTSMNICLGQAAPTFTATSTCYKWMSGLGDEAVTLSSGTSSFTPTIGTGIGQLNNAVPGNYTFYLADLNEVNPNCRTALTVTVSVKPGTPTINGAASVTQCGNGTVNLATNATTLGDNNVIGWWFTASPITGITDQSTLNTAIATATIGSPLTYPPNHIVKATAGMPVTQLAQSFDCSGLNGNTYYATPIVATQDVPAPASFSSSLNGQSNISPTINNLNVAVSQLPTNATLTQVCVNISYNACESFATHNDLDLKLQGPNGTQIVLESFFAGSSNVSTPSTFDVCFVDNGTGYTGASTTGCNGSCFTGNLESDNSFSGFDGVNPNGTWTLIVNDDNNTTFYPCSISVNLVFDMAPSALVFPSPTFSSCVLGSSVQIACACASCPTLTAAPPTAVVTNSSCAIGCTTTAGSITAPSSPCPAGSTYQYSLTSDFASTTTTPPAYTASAFTIYTRCSCDATPATVSPTSQVTTAPAPCVMPTVAPISGTFTVTNCAGATTTLSSTTSGGTWSSASTGVATITSGGVVTGVSAGTSVISYSVTIGFCTTTVMTTVTVTACPPVCPTLTAAPSTAVVTNSSCAIGCTPTAGSITTPSSPCPAGSTYQYSLTSDFASTTTTPPAYTASAFTIYTRCSCDATPATVSPTSQVTTAPAPCVLPTVEPITGTLTVTTCPGTNTTQLSSTTPGGSWSSGTPAVATVDGTGLITALSAGTSVISYSVTSNNCTTTQMETVTVTACPPCPILSVPAPAASITNSTCGAGCMPTGGVIAAPTSGTCPAGSTLYYSTDGAVMEFLLNPPAYDPSIVQNISTICICTTPPLSQSPITTVQTDPGVCTPPTVDPITGTNTLTNCVGVTTTLASTTPGGVWSSATPAVATIDASTGIVTGVSAGMSVISYTVTSGTCSTTVTTTVTVTACPCNHLPTAITSCPASGTEDFNCFEGTQGSLPGWTSSSSDYIPGGFYSNTAPAYANANSTFALGSMTEAAYGVKLPTAAGGNETMTYCLTNNSSSIITSMNVGWIVEQFSAGGRATTVDFSYSISGASGPFVQSNITGTTLTTASTLAPSANLNPITSTARNAVINCLNIAPGGQICFRITIANGAGTGNNAHIGFDDFSFTANCANCPILTDPAPVAQVTNSTCGAGCTPTTGTVDAPATSCPSGSIIEYSLDNFATAALISPPAYNATTPITIYTRCTCECISSPVSSITTVPTSCVPPVVTPIAGTLSVTTCSGATTTLSSTPVGGGWMSSNAAVATIDASGVVTGVSAGSSDITYTVTSGNCSTTVMATVMVTACPATCPDMTALAPVAVVVNSSCEVGCTDVTGSISAPATPCPQGSTLLYSIDNFATAGSTTIPTYTTSAITVSTKCRCDISPFTESPVSQVTTAPAPCVIPVVAPITGTLTLTTCAGVTSTLSSATLGGAWSSATPTVATIDASGIVTGVAAGTSLISYTVVNGNCSTTETATVTVTNCPPVCTHLDANILTCTTTSVENFNCFEGTQATLPTGWTSSSADYNPGGYYNIGGTYLAANSTFALGTTTDAAYGVKVGASAAAETMTYCMSNNTALPVTSFDISWDVEQYSQSLRATAVDFFYSLDGTNYIQTNITGITLTTATTGTPDANLATVAVTPRAITINGLNLAPGQQICFRIRIATGAGSGNNAHIGFDNFSVTANCATCPDLTPAAPLAVVTNSSCAVGCTTVPGSIAAPATTCPTGSSIQYSTDNFVTETLTSPPAYGATAMTIYTRCSCDAAPAIVGTISSVTTAPAPCVSPVVSPITGTLTLTDCPGVTTTLSSSPSGGGWMSSNTAVATIDASGVVTGVSTGTSDITYTVTSGNCTTTVMATVMVTACPATCPDMTALAPVAVVVNSSCEVGCTDVTGSISAPATPCPAGSTLLYSTNNFATAGSTSIPTYTSSAITVSTKCRCDISPFTESPVSQVMTAPAPCVIPVVAPITGTLMLTTCAGITSTLTSATLGGAWSSATPTVATIDASGIVTGLSAGTSEISYTVINGNCSTTQTAIVTVTSCPLTPCGHLFISEYVEGSSNNKYIEIYNPTNAPLVLTGNYSLIQYFNGSSTPSTPIPLVGTIPAFGTFIIANNSAALAGVTTNQTSGSLNFNGDDAIALVQGTTVLDVFGQIGFDPGTNWGTGTSSTVNNTLVRNPNVTFGDDNGSDSFDPSLQWTGLGQDAASNLGLHISDCACPDLSAPAPLVEVTNSSCGAGCITAPGSIAAPSTTCPTGSSIQYSTDNFVTETLTSPPAYGATAMTIYTRCSCNAAPAAVSPVSQVVTSPAPCGSLPSAPIAGTPTQPTCTTATASVTLSGLPATGTWTINPGAITGTGTSTMISGLAPGTYSWTVTNAEGCTSVASATVTIDAQPATPTAPIAGTPTQPTCTTATGSLTLSGLPATGTWTINPGAITGTGTSTMISGLAPGTYSWTVTNAEGCTSVASATVTIDAQPATPAAPIAGTPTQPTCTTATGSVTLIGLPATGTWTINPGAITGTGSSTMISGLAPGSYSWTVTSADGCTTVASATVTINPQPSIATCFTGDQGTAGTTGLPTGFTAIDPCSCNNNSDPLLQNNGTFNEFIQVSGPTGATITGTAVGATPSTLTFTEVVGLGGLSTYTSNIFTHVDGVGYTADLFAQVGAGAPTFFKTESNRCIYPNVVIDSKPAVSNCAGTPLVPLTATVSPAMAGTFTWGGIGVTGSDFNPLAMNVVVGDNPVSLSFKANPQGNVWDGTTPANPGCIQVAAPSNIVITECCTTNLGVTITKTAGPVLYDECANPDEVISEVTIRMVNTSGQVLSNVFLNEVMNTPSGAFLGLATYPDGLVTNADVIPQVNYNWNGTTNSSLFTNNSGVLGIGDFVEITLRLKFNASLLASSCIPNTASGGGTWMNVGSMCLASSTNAICTGASFPTLVVNPTPLTVNTCTSYDSEIQHWLALYANALVDHQGRTVEIVCNDYCAPHGWQYLDNCSQNAILPVGFTIKYTDGSMFTFCSEIIRVDPQQVNFLAPPQNLSLTCSGANSAAQIQAWLDNNGGAIAQLCQGYIFHSNNYTGALPTSCNSSLPVTFTITNECGLSATAVANISLIDNTPPSFTSVPASVTVACDAATPAFGMAIANDACSATVTITTADVSTGSTCAGTISVRTFTATDACGNTAVATQTITKSGDATPPTFTFVPANMTVSCDATPTLGAAVASDACSTVSIAVTESSQGFVCTGVLLSRVFTATDGCGNSAIRTQRITKSPDISVPVFTAVPADATIACGGTPTASLATATDACTDVTVTFADSDPVGNSCTGATITRTFTATDACFNEATDVQVFTIAPDTQAPSFTFVPENESIECGGSPSSMMATAIDACSTVTVAFLDNTNGNNPCAGGSITRTFTATDACNNTATATQIFTIEEDHVGPTFSFVPEDIEIVCGDAVVYGTPVAEDNCSAVTITHTDAVSGDACEGIKNTRTWTATDACGNTRSAKQVVWQLGDSVDPDFVNLFEEDLMLHCGDIPNYTSVSAVDNCGGTVQVTYEIEGNTDHCNIVNGIEYGYDIDINWRAEDACGNAAHETTTVWFMPNGGIGFLGKPADKTMSCSESWTFDQAPMAKSFFGEIISVSHEDISNLAPCGSGVITRRWTATDEMGNTALAEQTVIILPDTELPNLVLANNYLIIDCAAAIPVEQPLVTDNCSSTDEIVLTYTDQNVENTVKRTWTAQDACGNIGNVDQFYVILDTQAPIFTTALQNKTISCNTPVVFDNAVATDACSAVTLSYTDAQTSINCGVVHTRTWKASDALGHEASAIQVITVLDNTAPVFNFVPANLNVLSASQVVFGTPQAIDYCQDVQLSYTDVQTAPICGNTGFTVTRTWIAADGCNNQVSASQQISVGLDVIAPAFASQLTDKTAICGEVVTFDTPLANDNSGSVELTYSDTQTDPICGNSGYTMTRTWNAKDACNNETVISQSIEMPLDITSPVFTFVPNDEVVATADLINFGTPQVADECQSVQLNYTDVQTAPICGNTGYTITRTWIASDGCGNVAQAQQKISVGIDATAPIFTSTLTEKVINCGGNMEFDQPVVYDNSGTIELTFADDQTVPTCGNSGYTMTRKWIAKDACNNESVMLQNIIVLEDTEAPIFIGSVFDLEMTQMSLDNWVPTPLAAYDNCQAIEVVTGTPIRLDECYYQIDYTATDACGNFVIRTQNIHIADCLVLGTNEGELTHVSVYPNPVQDQLTILLPNSVQPNEVTAQVFDALGRQVIHNQVTQYQYQLDVQHLATGNYILRLSSGTNMKAVKFVKM